MKEFLPGLLQVPDRCLIQKRLPKAFFLKHFSLMAGEKKILNEQIDHIEWLASIKAVHIPAFVSDTHSYEEVQLFVVELRNGRVVQVGEKVAALIQKHIPYPLLVFVHDPECFLVNAARKRINQKETAKRTVDDSISTPELSLLYNESKTKALFNALRFDQLDKTDLRVLYGSYVQAIVQCRAAAVTGTFHKRPQHRSEQDLAALQRIDALESEIRALQSKVKAEPAMRERVELNVAIQERREKIEVIKRELGSK